MFQVVSIGQCAWHIYISIYQAHESAEKKLKVVVLMLFAAGLLNFDKVNKTLFLIKQANSRWKKYKNVQKNSGSYNMINIYFKY